MAFLTAKDNFGVRFLGYSFAFIELIYMVGVLFIWESGGILMNLLRINFYVMAIVGFGVGMIALFVHSIKIAIPEEEMDQRADRKWEGNDKWV